MTLTDPRFRIATLAATPNPQQCVYAAMHQDYSEGFVYDERASWPDETRAGEICVKRLLAGERGHYGPLEHAQIVLNVGWFPHSVMQQARTHRVGVSFDVQCMSEDTLITRVFESGEVRDKITMAEAYKLWGEGKKLRIRSLNEEENVFVPNEVEEVFSSGVKKVFRITMDDGKSIEATKDHRVLTISGWKRVGDLSTGDSILTNGVAARDAMITYHSKEWLKSQFDQGKTPRDIALELKVQTQTIRKWAYQYGLEWEKRQWNKGISYTIDISEEERERRRLHAINLNATLVRKFGEDHPSWKAEVPAEKRAYYWLKYESENFRLRANHQCERCGVDHHRLHCHHIKPVKLYPDLAFSPENILVLCPSCHKQAHSLVPSAAKVVSIEYARECPTYDLAMKAPNHNFVANGLVVHNSMRYTGDRIVQAASGKLDLEEVFYLRPVGFYTDRKGKKYEYSEHQRNKDLRLCQEAANRYEELILGGFAEEHARGILPFDYRQHFVVSFTLRSLMHFLDLRAKLDAQPEIRAMCDLILPEFRAWAPEIASWYESSRLHRARLAP
jgi:thymidylate synthase (FAD)